MDKNIWPRLNKCCCCFPLRLGSLIIGYTSLFISLSSLSVLSFSLFKTVEYVRDYPDEPNPDHSIEEVNRRAISLYISFAYFMLVVLYYGCFSLLLVIGVHRNQSNYLRYSFYAVLLLLVLASVAVVLTCIFFGVLVAFPLLKWCVILVYCLIVIRSTYLEMEEINKPLVYEMQSLYSPPRMPLDGYPTRNSSSLVV